MFVELILSAGLILSIFGLDEQNSSSTYVQMASVAIVAMAGLATAFYRHKRRIGLTNFEYAVIAISIMSIVTSLIFSTTFSFIFSMMYLLVFITFIMATRLLSKERLMRVMFIVYAITLSASVAFNLEDYRLALSVYTDSSGLFRFSPYNMHPNLTGFVYGGAALLFLSYVLVSTNRYLKLIAVALAGLSISVVLAASARSSLIAFGMSLFISYLYLTARGKALQKILAIVPALILVAVAAVNLDAISAYLNDLLELESTTRGVDSGGSGRVDLWSSAVNLLLAEPHRLLFGGGFRSASVDDIGFYLESSYLNIIFETGVAGLLMFVYFHIRAAVLFFKATFSAASGISFVNLFFATFIIYALIQSIFNRYLVALGNPTSVFVTLAVMQALADKRSRETGVNGFALRTSIA